VLVGLALVLLIVIFGHSGTPQGKGPASVTATTSSSPAASASSPVALSPGRQRFVDAIRSALSKHGDTLAVSDATLAGIGSQVCKAREAGASQESLISATNGTDPESRFDMSGGQLVRTAEKYMCTPMLPVPQTVEYIVTGTPGASVQYGPSGSNLNGSVPMDVTAPLGSPSYYAITAQLQGDGAISCAIKVDGKVISQGAATGGYNICTAEIGQDPFTGKWQDDNSG
jgi:hypothetical protein